MHDHRFLDAGAWVSLGIAAVSFWQGFALFLTIIATLLSIVLASVRIHDRLRYGPPQGRGR